MKRLVFLGTTLFFFVFALSLVWAQKTVKLSIATGTTGGVYYPMGRGIADILSQYIPYVEATAEVTEGSADNCLWVGRGKVDLALVMADTALDANQGRGKAFKKKIPLRTLAVLYPNMMHIVTLEGKGIEKGPDLKGKRISTGAPGSGTEVMALRILEAFGVNPGRDVIQYKLGVSESAGALQDKKIDAFFWAGGIPTVAITDLGATPGIKMKLIPHADRVPKMKERYGSFYVRGSIPAKTYPLQDLEVPIAVVWNLLVSNEKMKEAVAYDIVKTLFDHKLDWAASHREARHLSLEAQTGGSPIPFHPGAIRYFIEKGLRIR